MMGSIAVATKTTLLDLFYGTYSKDADAVVRALVGLGIIVPTADRQTVKRSVAFFLQNLSRQTERKETVAVRGKRFGGVQLRYKGGVRLIVETQLMQSVADCSPANKHPHVPDILSHAEVWHGCAIVPTCASPEFHRPLARTCLPLQSTSPSGSPPPSRSCCAPLRRWR